MIRRPDHASDAYPRRAELPDPKACPDPARHARLHPVAEAVKDAAYLQALCPGLHVGGSLAAGKPLRLEPGLADDLRTQLDSEGVVQVAAPQLPWQLDVGLLARSVVHLMQCGWPPAFIMLYDEVWALIHRASRLMASASGGNQCNMDILAWYVDPNEGHAGFSPHRDRQPDDSPATFRPDGSPMYSTCWVPLTDACPENSCLHVVPRWADPGYYEGDDDNGPDPLSVALPDKNAFQAIRSLPAEAGSAVLFTHRTIHWGSRGRKGYHTPRVAVSWGNADDSYEPPYFSREHLPLPPMALRMALACGQMIVYHERFDMTRQQLLDYYSYFTASAADFSPAYRAIVRAEFIAATKEKVGGPRPAGPAAAAAGTQPGGFGMRKKEKTAAAPPAKKAAAQGKAAANGAAAVASSGSKRRAEPVVEPASPPLKAAAKRASRGDGKAAALEDAPAEGAAPRSSNSQRRAELLAQAAQPPKAAATRAGRGGAAPAPAPAAAAKAPVPSAKRAKREAAAPSLSAPEAAASTQPHGKRSKRGGDAVEAVATAMGKAAGPVAASSSRKHDDDDADDDDEELLDAQMDAMLDAQMAGAGDDFEDDFDDFEEGGEDDDGGDSDEEESEGDGEDEEAEDEEEV